MGMGRMYMGTVGMDTELAGTHGDGDESMNVRPRAAILIVFSMFCKTVSSEGWTITHHC